VPPNPIVNVHASMQGGAKQGDNIRIFVTDSRVDFEGLPFTDIGACIRTWWGRLLLLVWLLVWLLLLLLLRLWVFCWLICHD
jgi:hypothetical protein